MIKKTKQFSVSLLACILILVVYSYSLPLNNETYIVTSQYNSTINNKTINQTNVKDEKGDDAFRNVQSETTEATNKVNEGTDTVSRATKFSEVKTKISGIKTKTPEKKNKIRIDDGILPDSQKILTDQDILITVKTGRLLNNYY